MDKEKIIYDIVCGAIGKRIEDESASLLDCGLDSFKIIGIIVELEKAFSIRIPDEMLMIDCWENLKKIKENITAITLGVSD